MLVGLTAALRMICRAPSSLLPQAARRTFSGLRERVGAHALRRLRASPIRETARISETMGMPSQLVIVRASWAAPGRPEVDPYLSI